MPKPPTTQEIALDFLESNVAHPRSKKLFIPGLSLLWNENDNSFYIYEEDIGCWRILSDHNVKTGIVPRMIQSFLLKEFPTVSCTTQKLSELAEFIARVCENRFHSLEPSLNVAFNDKTLSFPSLEFISHSSKNLAFLHIPVASTDLAMPTPNFNAYLQRAFDDPVERDFIVEMLGYLLFPGRVPEDAAFYLHGPPRTGKTRIFNLISEIFGREFCTSFSMQSLTTKDQTVAALAGKAMNILDEDESERIAGDRFKSLISHSPIEARRLYEEPFSIIQFCKFVTISNQLPLFKYVDGLERRIHFIHFKRILQIGEQDKFLDEKLKAELPGIIGQALASLKAFIARNYEFKPPQSSMDLKAEVIRMSKPVTLFLDERCLIISSDDEQTPWVSNQGLYDEYKSWCKDSGQLPLSAQNFHRHIMSLPEIRIKVSGGEKRKNIVLLAPGSNERPSPVMSF